VTKFLEARGKPPTPLSGQDAAQAICSSAFDDYVGFDLVDAGRLGIELGQTVSVAPSDTGKFALCFLPHEIFTHATGRNHPTTGKLVGLNGEECVLEVQGSSGSPVRCHFPRLNFNMTAK
jgi:hypothetical protein